MTSLGSYDSIARDRNPKCWSCQKPLLDMVRNYPHSDGWQVDGQPRQWLYLTCSACGAETSFSQLGIPKG